MATRGRQSFNFLLSCDVKLQVRVRISRLLGLLPSFRNVPEPEPGDATKLSAVYVVARITAGKEEMGLETRTKYADATLDYCAWNELLTFCVKYSELQADSAMTFSLYELREGCSVVLVGGATLPLFSKRGRLKTGAQRIRIWEGVPPSTQMPSETPGKVPLASRGQLARVEHMVKLYRRGEVPRSDWLDRLTSPEIRALEAENLDQWRRRPALSLIVELPTFLHAVLYQASLPRAEPRMPPRSGRADDSMGFTLLDPEIGRDNPAELKAAKLARGHKGIDADRDAKPNSEEKKRLEAILRTPLNKPLQSEDKDLLWSFRFTLTKEKRALTKFCKCVDWSDAVEARQAVDLMSQWAPINTAEALELLSPDFRNEEVRAHAVSCLQARDDEELLSFLLQLVQGLRYEKSDNSRLARLLVERALLCPHFAISLHWYLSTELEDPQFGPRAAHVHQSLMEALTSSTKSSDSVWCAIRNQIELVRQLSSMNKELKQGRAKAANKSERLREMLSEAGVCGELSSLRVPLPLNPSIMLEGVMPNECSCFSSAMLPLRLSFRASPSPPFWSTSSSSNPSSAPAPAAPPALTQPQPNSSRPPPHPRRFSREGPGGLGPEGGTSSEGGRTMGRSNSLTRAAHDPFVGTAKTGLVRQPDGWRCILIYKKGDDLRQDQFILQMVGLMDGLLKREAMDLRLTPYAVMPTSSDDGLVEYVPSTPLSHVLRDHRTIHRFLAKTQADEKGPFGLKAEVVETFVRSCAGYCVLTFLLGVGDRHLDNLMLCTDGRLFHIDFGYILGQDPKPFPPPMKLCKEMIEAMGGQDSIFYVQFRMYACEAYNILRKSADLVFSLFHLMAGASIEAIRKDPEKAMLKLQDKFRLDIEDDEASSYMQKLINESATAIMPQISEITHRWAQYWR